MRSWWRREQQSIRTVLATVSHHSFGRVDTAHGPLRSQKAATRTEAAGAQYFSLDDEELRVAGERPAALAQLRERHIAIVMEFFPFVPILGGPVSLQGNALVDFIKGIIVEPVIEQVIEVPKISPLSLAPTRSLLRAPQTTEELLEVPSTPRSAAMSIMAGYVQGPHQQYYRQLLQEFLLRDDNRDDEAEAERRPRAGRPGSGWEHSTGTGVALGEPWLTAFGTWAIC